MSDLESEIWALYSHLVLVFRSFFKGWRSDIFENKYIFTSVLSMYRFRHDFVTLKFMLVFTVINFKEISGTGSGK